MTNATQPPQKPKDSRLTVVLSIVVFAAIGGFFLFSFLQSQKDIAKGSVGDCAAYKAGAKKPYTLASCDSAGAKYKILGYAKLADKQNCLDIAGTTRTVTSTSGDVCMTDKNADPQKGINTIKVGDCMSLSGSKGAKADCSSTDAAYVVLKRIDGASKVSPGSNCRDYPETTKYYGWGIEQTGSSPYRVTAIGYDRLFCLGDNQS